MAKILASVVGSKDPILKNFQEVKPFTGNAALAQALTNAAADGLTIGEVPAGFEFICIEGSPVCIWWVGRWY